MEHITKPSITRLARRAGVKSLSEDCYNNIRCIVIVSIFIYYIIYINIYNK